MLSGDQNFVSGDLFTGVKSPKGDLGKIQLGALKGSRLTKRT